MSAPACPYCGRELVDQADVERRHCGWCREFVEHLRRQWAKVPTMDPRDAFDLGREHGRLIFERHRERERGAGRASTSPGPE